MFIQQVGNLSIQLNRWIYSSVLIKPQKHPTAFIPVHVENMATRKFLHLYTGDGHGKPKMDLSYMA